MSIKITNELLKRYADNQCTSEEKIYVELWYNKYTQSKQAKVSDVEKLNSINHQIWTGINQGIHRRPNSRFTFLKAAAAITVLVSISFAIYQFNNDANKHTSIAKSNFVSGKVKAQVMVASNSSIVYGNSDVKSMMSELSGTEEMSITTQIGEEYHAVLTDGSEIWLNANSEIVIPANFNETYRDLKLKKGEAYFKVAKDKTKPFRVFAAKTKIEALGTEFNVNYYSGNKGVKAFLIEGSISVSKKDGQSLVKPNQLYEGDDVTGASSITEVEKPETQYAWKTGYFEYSNTPLNEILEDLSRWYNFSFEISPIYKNKTLTGKIARKQPFSEVLAILEFSGIKYRKEGVHLALIP
ncbi:FecR family protein [Pedobacter xixiisoli]|uniref:FecR family protein n=1 Tax=Pedobacter xixiisoli TaxID=1476464 RepID=A0A285ZYX7_9SPHI|nr:FecR family protein [Pedobacter xixiisoli]SOD14860.1 FecR family protein [Pedobacter xixiisoli]